MITRPTLYKPHMPSLAVGLLGWWPFYNGSLVNAVGNGFYNGSIVGTSPPKGGPTPLTAGRFFDGTGGSSGANRITCGGHPGSIISSANAVTAAAWVKPGNTTRGDILTYWSTGILSDDLFDLLQGASAGKFQFFISNGTATGSSGAGATSITAGLWYHVAGTYDGTTIRLYVNGAQDASASGSGLVLGSTNSGGTTTFVIGDNSGDGSNLFHAPYNGTIADARVYYRALSAAEIFALSREAYMPQVDIESVALMHGAFAAAVVDTLGNPIYRVRREGWGW